MSMNVKTPPPTGHPNTPSQNHDYVNSTPKEQICNIKMELVALKSFVTERINFLKNALKKRNFHQRVITSQTYCRRKLLTSEKKIKRKSEKNKNAVRQIKPYRCLHTNTTDTAVPEKQTIAQDNIKTKPTNTIDSWTNTDISNKKTDHASQDGNSLTISQLRHPYKEIKPKRIKENRS